MTIADQVDPTINNLDDLVLVENLTDVFLFWSPSDAHPDSYVVYRDGAVLKFGSWNTTSENISVYLGELPVGVYNFTVVVTDVGGNTASDYVVITVTSSTITTTTTTNTTRPTNPDPAEQDILQVIILIASVCIIVGISVILVYAAIRKMR